MACIADLEFTEVMVSPDDADARNKLLLLAPSIRLPCLTHDGAKVWNMLAIAQYLKEIVPDAGLMPDDRIARGHCYSVGGEMTSGFDNLRAALSMHLKARRPRHKVSPGAQPDIDRIVEFWTDCLATHGRRDACAGRDALSDLRPEAEQCVRPVLSDHHGHDAMKAWVAAASLGRDDIEEFDMAH